MPTISFAGLSFADDQPDNGFAVSRLMGWYDGAPVRSDSRERPQSDGAFGVDRYFRDARVITVEGDWVGSSMAAAYAARDAMASIQSTGVPSTFTVTDDLGVRSCQVTLHREPTVDDVMRSPFFSWKFDVIARDPRKYGPEQVVSTGLPVTGTGFIWEATWPADWGSGGSAARVDMTNAGTVPTSPILEVAGGLSGGVELVEITTGSYLRLERDIPETSRVFFNTRTARAYIDIPANDISSFLTKRDWSGFTVPAASVRTVQFNPLGGTSGTPGLTARYSSAY
jgi:hypothetical protein